MASQQNRIDSDSTSSEEIYREFSLGEAINAANERISSLDLHPTKTEVRSYDYTIPRLSLNVAGKEPIYSAGKGIGMQADASCLFEFLEHFGIENYGKLCKDRLELREIDERAFCKRFSNDLVSLERAKDLIGVEANFYRYDIFDEVGAGVDVIPELVDRWWRINSKKTTGCWVSKYFSSIGFAAGMSFKECFYHGVSEILEHDAVSRFLQSVFFGDKPEIKLLDPGCASSKIRDIWDSVQEAIGSDIFVFDVTSSRYHYPTYYAIPSKQIFEIGYTGAGASIHPENAVERALLELLQDWKLRNIDPSESAEEASKMVARVRRYPRFKAACNLNVKEILGLSSGMKFVEMRRASNARNLKESVDSLINDHLHPNNLPIYYLQVMGNFGAPFIYSFVAPGAETFSLIRGGYRLIPRSRPVTPV